MKFAATAIALLLALTAQAAAKTDRPTLLGIVWHGRATDIVKLDGLSLKPISRRARVNEPSWIVARSPAWDRAVITIGESQDRLRVLDLRRMRLAGRIQIARVQGSLWPDAHRLVLLTGAEQPSVYLVDPITRRVSLTKAFEGSIIAVTRRGTRLVALLAPKEKIGPASLVVVDADGTVRDVALPGLRAGWQLVDGATHRSRQEVPGLALDPTGRRAVVVPAVGSIADVDLGTLEVAFHAMKVRTLARRQKALEGWVRSATWFGPNLVAVTGADSSVVGESTRMAPAGLTLIDTRDWSTRIIEPRATSVAVAGTTLLVCGALWNPERERSEGMGLSGYAQDGTRQFHLFGEASVPSVQVLGAYVYVASDNNTRYIIVDPRSGRIVARVSTPVVTTLAEG